MKCQYCLKEIKSNIHLTRCTKWRDKREQILSSISKESGPKDLI